MASRDGIAQLHEVETGKLITTFKAHKGHVHSIAFSPSGKQIVTIGEDHATRFWDTETGRQIASSFRSGEGNGIYNAVISSDVKQVVTVGVEETPRLWDANTGALMTVLRGHKSSVLGAGFTSDGKRIATASEDGTIRIWDTKTGKTLAVLEGAGKVWNVAFSGDAGWIVTASDNHLAEVWRIFANLQNLIDVSKASLQRCLLPAQLEEAFLQLKPPDWCLEQKKWPYDTIEWTNSNRPTLSRR